MINIRLYHSKAFKKEGGYFIFSCHNNDDLEGITLFGVVCILAMQRYAPYFKQRIK